MIRLRALLFNTLFYAMLIGYMVVCLIVLFIPRAWGRGIVVDFMRRQLALQRLFGMTIDVRGRDHLPLQGGIIAAKHQSMWETFALYTLVPDAVFIYKKELGRVPLFGSYLRKFEQIEIDRQGGPVAAEAMTRNARRAIDLGRQILIFPEGTRRPAGAEPKYKMGVARIYASVGCAVVPIVLNSGFFWSNFFWRGQIGRIVVEVLPPIEAGLSPQDFFNRLVSEMEAASNRLFIETATAADAPPLDAFQKKRLAELIDASAPQPDVAAAGA